MSWTALSQPSTDSVYCLPLQTARLLISDAMRLPVLDSMLTLQTRKVDLLESANQTAYNSFTNLLKIEQQKYEKQKEITANMESWGNSWRDQSAYYEKKDRKHRRQKKGLVAGIIILIGVLVVK